MLTDTELDAPTRTPSWMRLRGFQSWMLNQTSPGTGRRTRLGRSMNFPNNAISAFPPERIGQLQKAFDRSWQALSFAFADRSSQQACEVRVALAHCIVEIAQDAESDAVELSNRALARLPPYASYWTSKAQ